MLDLLSDFTLYERPQDDDGTATLRKLVARYTQYEAVNLICDRAKDPARRKGLIYHTQGSGKTLAMVFAAARLLRDPAMQNPTIVLVADRVQLVSPDVGPVPHHRDAAARRAPHCRRAARHPRSA